MSTLVRMCAHARTCMWRASAHMPAAERVCAATPSFMSAVVTRDAQPWLVHAAGQFISGWTITTAEIPSAANSLDGGVVLSIAANCSDGLQLPTFSVPEPSTGPATTTAVLSDTKGHQYGLGGEPPSPTDAGPGFQGVWLG